MEAVAATQRSKMNRFQLPAVSCGALPTPAPAHSRIPATLAIVILSLLLCFGAQAAITQVQQVSGSAATCGSSAGISCAVAVLAAGGGNILIAVFALQGAGSSVTAVSDSTGETWVHAPGCYVTSGNSVVDCWYVLRSTSGATTITGTLNTSGSGRAVEFYEFSVGAGCVANFDNSGSANDGTLSTSPHGVGLSLAGTNDVIVQGIYGGAVSSVSGGYAEAAGATNRAAASLLNTISGTAPIWTTSSAAAAVNAIAINEACSVSVNINPTRTTLYGLQTQQFSATVVGALNTGVTWSISPPGVGSVSNTGLYTAPDPSGSAQVVTVRATSQEDGTTTGSATVTIPAGGVLGTFQLSELFGNAWPDQPIEFRYDGGKPTPGTALMIGPLGTEVPFQWVSSCSDAAAVLGCIAVRSNLPANASYSWTLLTGVPAATPVNPVHTNTVGNNLEITNGLTGMRIVTQAANPAPFNLAPIQGIRMPGGTWTGAGASPNLLYSQSLLSNGNVAVPSMTPMFSATGYSVTVVDQGPVKTVVKVNYTFNRPQYLYFPATVINTAGTGHYTLIVTLYANSKSVLLDEDTDMQFSYYLPVYGQLQPTTARWRGHDSIGTGGNPDPVCGYESRLTVTGATAATPIVITTATSGNLSNGQVVQIAGVVGNTAANGTYYAKTTGYPATQFALYTDSNLTVPVAGTGAGSGGVVKPAYRGQNVWPAGDAFQDLSYSLDRPAGNNCTAANYRKMLADNPTSAHAAGWYVEMYNSAAGAAAPVVGFYIGRASKQSYSAVGPSLPGLYSSSAHFITGAKGRGDSGGHPAAGSGRLDAMREQIIAGVYAVRGGDAPQLGDLHEHAGGSAESVAAPADSRRTELAGVDQSFAAVHVSAGVSGSNPGAPQGGWQWLYLTNAGERRNAAELGPERHCAVRHADLLCRAAEQLGRLGGEQRAGGDVAGQQHGGGAGRR